MKIRLMGSIALITTCASAQSFIAGWDFDNSGAADTVLLANWGAQAGSAQASWTHTPVNPPINFTDEFGISMAFDAGAVNNSFSFLEGGVDSNTGFDQFTDNFGGATQGFQSFTSDDSFTLSFDASQWQDIQLLFAFGQSAGQGLTPPSFTVETVDLSGLDGQALATYTFTPVLYGNYDNFAIVGNVIPEPSAYAAIVGMLAMGAVVAPPRRK